MKSAAGFLFIHPPLCCLRLFARSFFDGVIFVQQRLRKSGKDHVVFGNTKFYNLFFPAAALFLLPVVGHSHFPLKVYNSPSDII